MFSNYLKIAWRNLVKNKASSLINIFGLSMGMTIAILVALWINDELNVNKNFKNYDHIAKVYKNVTRGGQTDTKVSLPMPAATVLSTEYAGDFKAVAATSWTIGHILAAGEKKIMRLGKYAEPALQTMLPMDMAEGGMHGLDDPSSVIIDRSTAKALFGHEDPMGKMILVDDRHSLKVSGVFEDFPYGGEFSNIHYLLPWSFFEATKPWVKAARHDWDDNYFRFYAQLQDNADPDLVSQKIKGILTDHEKRDKPEVFLLPMSRWNLYSEFKNGKNTGGNIIYVNMFGLIGFFVLLLACINFMNLSTARSERRAREVGIRKAMGSMHKQLIAQFLGESLLVTVLAFFLSLLAVRLALPWFNEVADKRVDIPWGSPLFWLAAFCFTFLTGLLAGSYPAFYLSSFNSVKVLKGTFKAGRLASLPRKILVVLQFTVSVALIVGTMIVYAQLQYARSRPIGYTPGGLITINMNTMDLYSHYNVIRHELIGKGAITDMSISGSPTTDVYHGQSDIDWDNKDPQFVPSFGVVGVTTEFGKTVGWQVKEGRDFSRDFASDSSGLVINEAAVKYMGLKNPIGARIRNGGSSYADKNFHVIGVIEDMIMQSPYDPVTPTLFTLDSAADGMNIMTLRMNPHLSTDRALALIEPVFKQFNPGAPFSYDFNDEEYAQKFALEQRIGTLSLVFAVFAVFISCLGLFGLASFTAEQRTREIGLRKVLGATVLQLWGLLSFEFLALVALSLLLALPLSYYYMVHWLQRYEYHTTIPAWIFIGAVGLTILITLVTVSFQSIRASLANPVKSLRVE